jgi:hypothetical protein
MRRLCFLLIPVLLLVGAGPARAQTAVLDRAAQELRRNSVYVDPAAERPISDSAAQALRDRIAGGRSPIFVAVLPASAVSEAGGDPSRLPSVLGQKVSLQGTYAVVAGNSFRAASNALPAGRAGSIATSSFQAQSAAGTEAVLATFVDRVNQAAAAAGGSSSGSGGDEVDGGRASGGTSGGGSGAGLLVLLGIGGAGLFLWSGRRRRQRQQEGRRARAADRQVLEAELSVLGDDVLALEPEVTMHPEARADYDAGVTRYKSAEAAMQYADDRVDLVRVGRVIDEGRYAMARARARTEGREPPPPPEQLRQRGRRDEPALDVDSQGTPVYVGYGGMPWYGGGWFGGGGGGGLLTGLMLGEMLGGGWGGGGWGGGYYDDDRRDDDRRDDDRRDDDGGGQGAGLGGDWAGGGAGGGDWGGGGDFGGGDFGGGDFGGGDAGGGDW